MLPIPRIQDFAVRVQKMRELGAQVPRWLARGDDYDIAVDFTGGTKPMFAVLALGHQRQPCRFLYVEGTTRTKGGVVVSGTEFVVQRQNPWNAPGCRAVEVLGDTQKRPGRDRSKPAT